MGLADAYAKNNNGFGVYTGYEDPNLEFSEINHDENGTYKAGEIMASNGLPCTNDIEMILQAFIEGKNQYFYFYYDPTEQPTYELLISKAIKNPIIIYEAKSLVSDEFLYFTYDRNYDTYPIIGNNEKMLEYIKSNIKN
jgi:hypothetical protein